jgi:hypothetical protein
METYEKLQEEIMGRIYNAYFLLNDPIHIVELANPKL